jgi:hypothetical protein
MKHLLLIIVLFIFCCSSSLIAQEYSATVIDSKGEEITFAHVFFNKEQARGSITNEAGEFTIYVKPENEKDSLVISILGYKTKFISYADIDKYDNTITMQSSNIQLNEVVILSDTYLKSILKEAIAAIPENYPREKFIVKAYYQEYTISDDAYSEMIEADIAMESDGYLKNGVSQKIYLNQLRKTEDNRLIPDRLKTDRNMVITLLNSNALLNRSFAKYRRYEKDSDSFEKFIDQVDQLRNISVHRQQVQDQDTILTIKFSDPIFKSIANVNSSLSESLFVLVSINLTNRAFVRIVHGDVWSDEADFQELVFRNVDGTYYPSYMRDVTNWEYEKRTLKHYNSRNLFFYELVKGKDSIKKYKKGKKMNIERGLRLIHKKTNESFWSQYTYANNLPAATIIRSKFGIK